MRVGIFVILGGMLAGNVGLGWWMRRRLGDRRGLALALLLFQLPLAGQIVWMLLSPRTAIRQHEWLPAPLIALTYFWNLVVVPLSLAVIGLTAVLRRILPQREAAPTDESRRRFLAAVAACTPPAAAGIAIAAALPKLHDFRVRRLEVPLARLPRALDGMTIAHVSDVHYGKFTDAAGIERVIGTVNGLGADLVLLTGDLIDLSLRDLDAALAMVRRFDRRAGLFLCEGNHDLIDDGAAFRRRVSEAGVPLLLDEAETAELRGEKVQILGARWRRGERRRRRGIEELVARRDEEAFSILLAHHPHSFDYAGTIPLTLSGHTHGGLLMLNERLGAGPVLYRYWSGLYRKEGRALVVSNGVGTWFPVRTHAPAEIVHLTLTRPA